MVVSLRDNLKNIPIIRDSGYNIISGSDIAPVHDNLAADGLHSVFQIL